MALAGLRAWLRIMGEKYVLRKEVHHYVDRRFKVLYYSFMALGRFLRKVRKIRFNRRVALLKGIVSTKKGLWRLRRRIKAKKKISTLMRGYEASPVFLVFAKFVIRRLVMVQKWYRRSYVKKLLMLALMNMQWSFIEYALVKENRGVSLGSADIEKCIKEGKTSDAVPLDVRLAYFRKYLTVRSPLREIRLDRGRTSSTTRRCKSIRSWCGRRETGRSWNIRCEKCRQNCAARRCQSSGSFRRRAPSTGSSLVSLAGYKPECRAARDGWPD